jgi:hypothetical protein
MLRYKLFKLRYELYWAFRKTCARFNIYWMRITLIFPDGSKQTWYPRKSVVKRYVNNERLNPDDYKAMDYLSARLKRL